MDYGTYDMRGVAQEVQPYQKTSVDGAPYDVWHDSDEEQYVKIRPDGSLEITGGDHWVVKARKDSALATARTCLIWSNQQERWWRPARRGYTTHLAEAGKYTRAEAEAIVADATCDGRLVRTRTDPITGVEYTEPGRGHRPGSRRRNPQRLTKEDPC